MFLTILVITQAAAEWVEISQQHYRKPIRTHSSFNPFTTPDQFEVEDTTNSWTYNNRSVTEYNWNKAPKRQSNVKRVQYPNGLKTTEPVRLEDKYSDIDSDEFELKTQEPTKSTIEYSDNTKQKGTITRIPNIGNVKRVQLQNTPVKSPFLNMDHKDKTAKTRYEELPLENEEEQTELIEHKRRSESKVNNRRIYVNGIKKQYHEVPASTFPTEDEFSVTEKVIKSRLKPEYKNHTKIKNILPPKPTFITETEDFAENVEQEDKFYKDTESTTPRVMEKKRISTTVATDIDEDMKNNEEIPKQSIKPYQTSNTVKHEPIDKLSQEELNRNRDNVKSHDERKPNKKSSRPEQEQHQKPLKQMNSNKRIDPSKEKDHITKGNKPDSKVNNMENLVKLMKVVADTISQNSRRSFGGKMRYLHGLKDTILANIAERIDATWPDDDVNGLHRRSRSAHASARGHHVHFPSSESALMTISFLTFAVFLIKLVLQVIHTYKNKTMMVAPVMVAAAGRTAFAQRGSN